MGLKDKLSASVKNVNIKIGAGRDESKYNSKIKELDKDSEELKYKLGDGVYQAFLTNEVFDHEDICVKIRTNYENIDVLQKEKQEMLEEMAAERERNREEAKTKG